MTDANLKKTLADFGNDVNAYLAYCKAEFKGGESMIASQRTLDLTNADDLKVFEALMNQEKVTGYAGLVNALSRKPASMTQIDLGDLHKDDDATTVHSGKNGFQFMKRVVWGKHPQLGFSTLLHLNVPVKDGNPIYEVKENGRLVAPLHVIPANAKLVRITRTNEIKEISFKQESFVLGSGSLDGTRQAVQLDIQIQANAFANAGVETYGKNVRLNIEL